MRHCKWWLGLALALGGCLAPEPRRELASVLPGMEYTSVCGSGGQCRRFSRLIMGTHHLVPPKVGSGVDSGAFKSQVFQLWDEALRMGINTFDTSPIYKDFAEDLLGQWMRARAATAKDIKFYGHPDANPDQALYALSKGGFPFDLHYAMELADGLHSPELIAALCGLGLLDISGVGEGKGAVRLAKVPPGTCASRLYGPVQQIRDRIAAEVAITRKNLGAFLTGYFLHRDDRDFIRFKPVPRAQTRVASILEALRAPDISGQFLLLGLSNWEPGRVEEAVNEAKRSGQVPTPVLTSAYFSLFEMSSQPVHVGGLQVTHKQMSDPRFLPGVKEMSYSPLGGFSILDQPEPKWENARQAAKQLRDAGDPYWQNVFEALFTPENQARFDRVVEFTDDFNRRYRTSYTVDQMLHAYVLAHRRTDFLVIGATTVDQLRRTVASLQLARRLSSTPAVLDFLYGGGRRPEL